MPARLGHLAMVLHAWEQYETAAGVYARARALERRYDWFYLGGLVETRLAHHAAAARLLADAVQMAPGSTPARLALADALFESGDVAGAAREYSSLTTGPSAPHAHYGLGRSLAAKGEKEAALREIEAAVQLFPEFGAAWYAEAMVLRGLGRSAEARKAIERAKQFGAAWPSVDDPAVARMRALRDDAGPHVKRGLSLQKQGDVAGAIAEYEAAIAADPQLGSAHVNLIALYGRQQGWDEGRVALPRPRADRPGASRSPLQLRHLSGGAAQERRGRRHVPDGAGRQPRARRRAEQPRPTGRARGPRGRGRGVVPEAPPLPRPTIRRSGSTSVAC